MDDKRLYVYKCMTFKARLTERFFLQGIFIVVVHEDGEKFIKSMDILL